jgi:DNA-binding transcriptional ArsR family regulator
VDAYLQSGLDALGDATRMAIFDRLSRGPLAVHELAATMPVSRPAVSQHLRVLKDAGLVLDSKSGTRRVYQLSPEGIARLRDHFDRVWTRALSSFQIAASQAPVSPRKTAKKSLTKGESRHARNSRKSRRP